MCNTLVDICNTLATKALLDRFILVELATVCQALKLKLLEVLLDLAEGQLNCVVLRAIRHVVDEFHL